MTNEQLYQEMQNYQEDEGSGEEEEKEVTAVPALEVWGQIFYVTFLHLNAHIWDMAHKHTTMCLVSIWSILHSTSHSNEINRIF